MQSIGSGKNSQTVLQTDGVTKVNGPYISEAYDRIENFQATTEGSKKTKKKKRRVEKVDKEKQILQAYHSASSLGKNSEEGIMKQSRTILNA